MSPPSGRAIAAAAVEAKPPPWTTTTIVCPLGVALAAPEWLPHAWTREDGPVEYATFSCFFVASALALAAALRLRRARRPLLATAALCVVLFVAAGEEISWGQRLLDLETPAELVDGNAQDELNLHNLEGAGDVRASPLGSDRVPVLRWLPRLPRRAPSVRSRGGGPRTGTRRRPSSCLPQACWGSLSGS